MRAINHCNPAVIAHQYWEGRSGINILSAMNVPSTCRAKKLAIHMGAGSPARVGEMLERQAFSFPTSQRDIAGGTIGCVGNSVLPAQGNVCFFTGAPINGPSVDALAGADSAGRLLPQYDGPFVGVYWDAACEILTIVTDCLGMQPLYIRRAEGELTLVSETKALHGEPDIAAWGAFISMGHSIGERTLMDGLRHVPPASVLTYTRSTDQLSTKRYWSWPNPSDAWRRYDFLEALEADIRGYSGYGAAGTVLLSGGFDSRLLLFLLLRAGVDTDALIVAHEDEFDDADGRLAQAVAELTRVSFRRAYPDADFFSTQAFVDYLRDSDAAFPSLGLFIAKVASQIRSPAVWEGLIPAIAFNTPHQTPGGFDDYRRHEIRSPDSTAWRAAKTLFRPEIAEAMLDGFSDDLRAAVSEQVQDMFGVLRFIIEHRSRNRTGMNPLKVFSNRAEAFTPGLSKDLMTHAAMIPFEERHRAKFYKRMLGQLDKRTLSLPFLSGGELVRNARISPRYYGELGRAAYTRLCARHPRLVPGKLAHKTEYSSLLGRHLFEGGDDWLNPEAYRQMITVTPRNYMAWKLLFHWKAWRQLHNSRFDELALLRSPLS